MASISGDENATQENDGTRRTRSGRKTSVPSVPVTPTRTTRRSARKRSSDDVSELDEKQILVENAAMPDIIEAEEIAECQQEISENIIVQDEERSSSFPFAAVQSDSNFDTNSQQPESGESINNFLANLVEENANSLPPTNVEDAEMVSEDELPIPAQPKVDDAEEVSDEELPGPKLAELPADTEVVSEDELPYKRKAETENSDAPEKRVKVEAPKTENDVTDATVITEKEPERKPLPDLDKYWKAVNDDPSDFTGWTYLLQYVEQENDIEAAREAYDAFLAHYPYCYGYWRKYADYEKRKGNKKKCEEVFERGLKAIPLSVDLWIHYLTHVKQNHADNEDFIRSQFERAVTACGLEFRSDKLWEAYIKWETENRRLNNVISVYDRLLTTPTQSYSSHFDNFQDIVNNNAITSLISKEEFKMLRAEARESLTKDSNDNDDDSMLAPGEDEPDDHVRNEAEASAIKDKLLNIRRKIHKTNVAAVTARWTFEEGIKRPYFHVKPLERCQLNNWKDYLDFEIEQGDRKRILVLFERCLIACALYEEYWLKLIHYLETQPNELEIIQKTREVYERACTIHHLDKPNLHLLWSAFEEQHDNLNKAAEILCNLDKICPNIMQLAYRRINLERRRGDYEKCTQLYENYASTAKNKNVSGNFAIKHARFCNKIKGDLDGAMQILKSALEKDPSNTRIVLQMIDLALQRPTVIESEVIKIMDDYLARDNIDAEQKVLFAQRKVEFLEDFGSSSIELQMAQRYLQSALTSANEAKKKSSESSQKKTPKENAQAPAGTTSSAVYNNSFYNSGTNSAYYGNSQYNAQTYGDTYSGYNQWQQQYGTGYGNYGQWSGYSSSGYY